MVGKVDASGRVYHDIVAQSGHEVIVVNGEIDIGAASCVVRVVWGLTTILGNRGEQMIMMKMFG